MLSKNRLTLIGFTGQDADVKFTPNGTAVARFTVATNVSWKDKQGEWKARTEWHSVVVWGDFAKWIGEKVRKGMLVHVEGELRYREYTTKENVEVMAAEVHCSEVLLLDRSPKDNQAHEEAPVPEEVPY